MKPEQSINPNLEIFEAGVIKFSIRLSTKQD